MNSSKNNSTKTSLFQIRTKGYTSDTSLYRALARENLKRNLPSRFSARDFIETTLSSTSLSKKCLKTTYL